MHGDDIRGHDRSRKTPPAPPANGERAGAPSVDRPPQAEPRDDTSASDPARADQPPAGASQKAASRAGGARGARVPPITLPSPRQDRFGQSRLAAWGKIGCVGGLVIGVGALLASFLLLSRGMQMLGERAIARVEESLPADLEPAEKERTLRNLAQLRVTLRHDAEAEAILSRFLGLVAPALEDRRLTAAEVATINQGIEQLLDPSGWVVDAPAAPDAGSPEPDERLTP